jgi:hypothetical protein
MEETPKKHNPKREKREEYFPRLKTMIANIGVDNVNLLELEREWGIPDTTLGRWKQSILRELADEIDPKAQGINHHYTLVACIKLLRGDMIKARSITERTKIAKTLSELTEQATNILERFDYKGPPKSHLDVTGICTVNPKVMALLDAVAKKKEAK